MKIFSALLIAIIFTLNPTFSNAENLVVDETIGDQLNSARNELVSVRNKVRTAIKSIEDFDGDIGDRCSIYTDSESCVLNYCIWLITSERCISREFTPKDANYDNALELLNGPYLGGFRRANNQLTAAIATLDDILTACARPPLNVLLQVQCFNIQTDKAFNEAENSCEEFEFVGNIGNIIDTNLSLSNGPQPQLGRLERLLAQLEKNRFGFITTLGC